jgi:hypothetical protein
VKVVSLLVILLIVMLVIAACGGEWSHLVRFGYVGWSMVAFVVLVLVVLFLTGHFGNFHF